MKKQKKQKGRMKKKFHRAINMWAYGRTAKIKDPVEMNLQSVTLHGRLDDLTEITLEMDLMTFKDWIKKIKLRN